MQALSNKKLNGSWIDYAPEQTQAKPGYGIKYASLVQ